MGGGAEWWGWGGKDGEVRAGWWVTTCPVE